MVQSSGSLSGTLPDWRRVDPNAAIHYHSASFRARSSAVEHYLDMVGVTGSIPVAPTTTFPLCRKSAGEYGCNSRLAARNEVRANVESHANGRMTDLLGDTR